MAKAQLTERQQEIKSLIEQGKDANQIGAELGISPNAVYQHLRRMRQAGSVKPKAAAAAAKSTPKSGRKSGGTSPAAPAAKPAPAPAPEIVVRESTPLQAIRARRDEIKASVKDAADALVVANAALREAQAAYDKASGKHADELKMLDGAESALTGKKIVDGKVAKAAPKRQRAPKASESQNGTTDAPKAASAPASAPSAPAEPAPAATAGDDEEGFHDPALAESAGAAA